MGAPKQKWTPEEEAALRAGVEKYGPGKWRAIQKDSKFGPCLTSRSNVDLKVNPLALASPRVLLLLLVYHQLARSNRDLRDMATLRFFGRINGGT